MNDFATLDSAYTKAVEDVADVQKRLGKMRKDDPNRPALTLALASCVERLREAKEARAAESRLRSRCGIGQALHEALRARVSPDTLAEVEEEALNLARKRQAEAEARKRATEGRKKPRPPCPYCGRPWETIGGPKGTP